MTKHRSSQPKNPREGTRGEQEFLGGPAEEKNQQRQRLVTSSGKVLPLTCLIQGKNVQEEAKKMVDQLNRN